MRMPSSFWNLGECRVSARPCPLHQTLPKVLRSRGSLVPPGCLHQTTAKVVRSREGEGEKRPGPDADIDLTAPSRQTDSYTLAYCSSTSVTQFGNVCSRPATPDA